MLLDGIGWDWTGLCWFGLVLVEVVVWSGRVDEWACSMSRCSEVHTYQLPGLSSTDINSSTYQLPRYLGTDYTKYGIRLSVSSCIIIVPR